MLAALVASALLHAPNWDLNYTIRLDDRVERARVTLCFAASKPLVVETFRKGAMPLVRTELKRRAGGWDAAGNECVAYSVDLSEARRVGGVAVLRGEDLLLRPAWLGPNARGTVRFTGAKVTTPWPDSPSAAGSLALDRSAFTMTSRVLVGDVRVETLRVAGVDVRLAVAGRYRAGPGGIRRWITTAVKTAAGLWGEFPVAGPTVLVTPAWGPVGIGHGTAHRGGAGHVLLYLGRQTRADALPGEWVAIHELLHLGLPWIREPWMSEGWVTYYEEVLRARAKILTPEQLWWELLDGFERGAKSGAGSLRQASETMHQTRAYKRVYWGGAATALAVDVALRTKTKHSLDDAIRTLQPICRSSDDFDAAAITARLDAWLGAPVVARTLSPLLKQPTFPDPATLLEALGVRRRGDTVTLDDTAPLARIRKAIETGN